MICKQAVLLLIIVSLASCVRHNTLTFEELHSDVVSSISLASETDVFASQIEKRRLSREFQSGHAAYLRDEAEREAKDLGKSNPAPGQLRVVQTCIDQLDLLARELALISDKTKTGDETELPAIRQRLQSILKSLTAAKAGL